jgi:probable HAF family extracellular repeat protein
LDKRERLDDRNPGQRAARSIESGASANTRRGLGGRHNDRSGTFFGGYDTWALSVNSRGEIVGEAYNTIPDSNSLFGYGYQSRAFYWNNGVVQDLGTLGTSNDAAAGLINERGQVIGLAFTSSTPDAFCTIYGWNPFLTYTTGSFFWDKKNGIKDIGGLGGACTVANDLNDQGQMALASETNFSLGGRRDQQLF